MTESLPENTLFTPEFRLVAACSWLPESAHAARQSHIIESLTNDDLNWAEVTSLVSRHGVIGQFCTIMGKRGWSRVPGETTDRLKKSRTQQAVRALSQVAELARIGSLFNEAGIAVVPLKGVALSQELYGDPCIRSADDLDILVRPEDVENAEELLLHAGYHHLLGRHQTGIRQKRHMIKSFHHHGYVNDARGVHIELHWKSFLWTKEQAAALWSNGTQSTWLTSGLMKLSREENILFLADHGSRHGWSTLKWLSDVAMLMQSLSGEEWLSLYNRAAFFDLQRVICQTAALLEWFYEIKPPQQLTELCAVDAVVQKQSIYAVSQLLLTAEEITLLAKRFAGPRLAYRIKLMKPSTPLSELLRSVMIGHADMEEMPLCNALFWLYLPLRPFLWLKRHYLGNAKHRRIDSESSTD